MYQTMRRDVFWPSISWDVQEFVGRCSSCARKRLSTQRKTTYLKLFPPSAPFEFVAMDILGPLPETKDGNRFLLVIVDRFSKLTRTVPLKTITAEEVSKAFVNEWFCVYGAPVVLLSDNGTQFVSKFFQSVCRLLGVKQVFTTAYHPASNGQCERFNRTVLNAITHYVSDNQDNWDELSYTATYAYNTTVQSSTGYTPFELTLSRTSPSHVLSTGIGFGVTPSSHTKALYRQKFLAECERLGHRVSETLTKSQERYKRTYDAHVRKRNAEIQIGDMVFVRTFVAQPGRSPKLDFPASGPYVVVSRNEKTFVIRTSRGNQRVSSDRITRAPAPTDLPAEFQMNVDTNEDTEDVGLTDEIVVDRIVGHGMNEDGQYMVKIRWHGQDKSEDTWQEASDLPPHFVERYAKKKKLSIEDISGPQKE
jgi:Integrase core domain/Chromo (CHRromatin Organisation MOdifier) domain